MRIFFKLAKLIFFVCALSGCSIFHHNGVSDSKKYEAGRNVAMLSRSLSGMNVSVFRDANSIKLVLLNKDFFIKNSANFTDNAYEALDLIFSLSSYYRGSSVAVTGYSNSGSDDVFGRALAVERARKIVRHLWRSKIDSSFMYASGQNVTFAKNKASLSDCVLIDFTD